MSNSIVSSNWAAFRKLWIIVAIILLILLILLWLLGYGPNGRNCQVEPEIVTKTVEVEKLVEVEKIVEKIVAAPDTLAPRISLNDSSVVRLLTGDTFTDKGAVALDNIDSGLEVTVDGKVDTSTPGEYILTYTAKDAAGNVSEVAKRTVIVEKPLEKVPAAAVMPTDHSSPQITLKGESIVQLAVGESFTDAGAKALDNLDGETDVTVTGNVDTKTPGSYLLTYMSTDKSGNTTTTYRKVIVAKPMTMPSLVIPSTAKLYFDNDTGQFPKDTESKLAGIINYLKVNNSSVAVISGFHSASGNIERNKELTIERSQSVVKLLLEWDVPADRLIIENPQESTGSGSAEEARRVEVKIRN